MEPGQPSQTALSVAAHRAAHQILEQGRIFADPLALRILGKEAKDVVRGADEPSKRRMRIFVAARTRFAEDNLANALMRGVRQLVMLGAGLDTYAYRSASRGELRIFEVDHPATQAWKRQRLAHAEIALPDFLTFAPINFERESLADALVSVGFDPTQQSFFTWLGVVPYLTEDAIRSTLSFIVSLPGGSHVVFDYSDPPERLSPEIRVAHEKRAAYVAALGEPWISYFEAETLRAKSLNFGFSEIEDLGPPEIAARYFPGQVGSMPARGGHIVRASCAPN